MQAMRIAGLLWLVSSLSGTAFAGMPRLQIRPAIPVGYTGDILRLQVKLPCGSRYFGLVAKGDGKGKVLQVAAAVTDSSVVCTSMPQVVEVGADFLATRHYETVAPMAVTAGTRIHAVPVEELRLVSRAKGPKGLHAVYTKHCGLDLGTVIHRSASNQLEIAMVEESVSKERATQCLAAPMARKISWVSIENASLTVKPLPTSSRSLARQFTMALASVNTVKATRDGITVSYQRHCNEAPVGLVLGASSMAHARIGVLVARYPNVRCLDEMPVAITELMNEPAIMLPQSMELSTLHQVAGADINLRAPSAITLEKSPKLTSLRLSFIDSCQLRYAVYARDNSGRLAVGTLAMQETPKAINLAAVEPACSKMPAQTDIVQPFIASDLHASQIYPLRVRGG
ncbi:MAG: hypothetical protein FJ146_00370 [Deltaproteobacteria bacterium]|nr:hypothetical protein [Deltaproteobacteria bacterium]